MKHPMRQAPVYCWLTAAAILSVLCVSSSSTPGFAQAPGAEAPAYTVGDHWRFSYGPVKIVAIEGDLVVREVPANKQCKDCRYYSDGQSVLVKVTNADGSEAKHPLIGFRALDFPLSVGKEWTYSATFFNEAANVMVPLKHTFRVLAFEDVQTKAGPLKAFKIFHSRELQHPRSSRQQQQPSWGTALYWYSPEAKAIVKRKIVSTGAVRNFGNEYELESFSLK